MWTTAWEIFNETSTNVKGIWIGRLEAFYVLWSLKMNSRLRMVIWKWFEMNWSTPSSSTCLVLNFCWCFIAWGHLLIVNIYWQLNLLTSSISIYDVMINLNKTHQVAKTQNLLFNSTFYICWTICSNNYREFYINWRNSIKEKRRTFNIR